MSVMVVVIACVYFFVVRPRMNAQQKAYCVTEAQQWAFTKAHLNSDDQAVRAQMDADDCAALGVTLPAAGAMGPGPANSSGNAAKKATCVSLQNTWETEKKKNANEDNPTIRAQMQADGCAALGVSLPPPAPTASKTTH
jgi:hypothetical protein